MNDFLIFFVAFFFCLISVISYGKIFERLFLRNVFLDDNISLTYEYASWQYKWYTNNVYKQGFTNEGNILGHWAMQAQHDSGTAAPGESHFLKSHWQTSWQHVVSVSIRGAEHQSRQYDDYWDIDIDYSFPVNEHLFSVGAYFGKDNFGESFAELSISAQWN